MTPTLQRFVDAQEDCYETAVIELRSGRKRTHWMWFIFPQLRGLGSSEKSEYFGIADIEEAAKYLSHTVLGPRLLECTRATLQFSTTPCRSIFEYPDDLKFVSCMTLFSQVPSAPPDFSEALLAFNAGKTDDASTKLLAKFKDKSKDVRGK